MSDHQPGTSAARFEWLLGKLNEVFGITEPDFDSTVGPEQKALARVAALASELKAARDEVSTARSKVREVLDILCAKIELIEPVSADDQSAAENVKRFVEAVGLREMAQYIAERDEANARAEKAERAAKESAAECERLRACDFQRRNQPFNGVACADCVCCLRMKLERANTDKADLRQERDRLALESDLNKAAMLKAEQERDTLRGQLLEAIKELATCRAALEKTQQRASDIQVKWAELERVLEAVRTWQPRRKAFDIAVEARPMPEGYAAIAEAYEDATETLLDVLEAAALPEPPKVTT